MRFATEALVIFVGVMLIWVILSGRGDRLATAWRYLFGGSASGTLATVGGAQASALPTGTTLSITPVPSLPSLSGLSGTVATA